MLIERVDVAVVGGGQSGLAAVHALRERGFTPVVLESSAQAAGAWPHYYDSLTLFSPTRYSSLPGLPFGGDPDRYPRRDEVVDHLLRYAERLDAEVRTGRRVEQVRADGDGFRIALTDGAALGARAVVAATGGFGRAAPAHAAGTGLLHRHRSARVGVPLPEAFAGRRVVVVGAGNSAVQVAAELSGPARVSPVGRTPVRWFPQRPLGGRDLHF